MDKWLYRTELLIGNENLKIIKKSTVAVFGIGGVGSYVVEALARAGIGNIVLIDNDVVDITNINRQLIANTTTIGKEKVQVCKERILKINPNINVTTYKEYYNSDVSEKLLLKSYDYVADCIDSVTSKIHLIESCYKKDIKIISSMGTGNKINPLDLEVTDIYKTSVCPLAKVIRKELKLRNIKKLKVVYSKENPICQVDRNKIIPSISFVPSTAGLIIASEIIKDLINFK